MTNLNFTILPIDLWGGAWYNYSIERKGIVMKKLNIKKTIQTLKDLIEWNNGVEFNLMIEAEFYDENSWEYKNILREIKKLNKENEKYAQKIVKLQTQNFKINYL